MSSTEKAYILRMLVVTEETYVPEGHVLMVGSNEITVDWQEATITSDDEPREFEIRVRGTLTYSKRVYVGHSEVDA